MHTYTQILYQIVFTPKHRLPVLVKTGRPRLFAYIAGIIRNNYCHLYQINGVENHLHIVTHLHPSVPLSSLVKDIKLASSKMIKREDLFPEFKGWQVGYSAFTYSIEAKSNLIRYVQNQEKHHQKESLDDELIRLYKKYRINYDEEP